MERGKDVSTVAHNKVLRRGESHSGKKSRAVKDEKFLGRKGDESHLDRTKNGINICDHMKRNGKKIIKQEKKGKRKDYLKRGEARRHEGRINKKEEEGWHV